MKKTILANGMTICTDEMPALQSVTLSYVVKAGSYQETNFPKGLAHFIEHMLFKGTAAHSAQELNEVFDFIGASVNAYTSYEKTKYYCNAPYDQWEAAADLLSEMMWQHTFPEKEMESERTVVLEEIKMYEDDPTSYVFDMLSIASETDRPERQLIVGTKESVLSITREDMVRFVETYYQPDNLCFIASGNIRHEDVVAYFDNFTFTRTSSTAPSGADSTSPPQQIEPLQVTRDIQQAHMAWRLPAPDATDPDRFAMVVLNTLLGGTSSSRLFRSIREERGLVYTVYSYYSGDKDAGLLDGYVGADAANLEAIKDLLLEELHRLREEDVSPRELQKAINYTKGTFMRSLESTGTLNEFRGDQFLYGTSETPEDVISAYERVTAADIRRLACTYFDPDSLWIASIVPTE